MDDEDGGPEKKISLTPKPGAQAIPLCTVMSDGQVKVQAPQIPLIELNGALLTASGIITERLVQRAAAMERVIRSLQQRFDGFDPETEQMMIAVLGGGR
jgi:hypothetical protein